MKTADAINGLTAINMALHDAMEADKNVIVLGEDVADPEGGGVVGTTRGLSEKFGTKRVRSTPISEQAIIGASIGASLVGMRPVAELMLMNFTTVAMDMIVNHAAKLRFMSGGQTHVPITIRTMTGAGFGNGGQHSDFLEAWFAHTAGLKIVVPSNPADAYGLMLSCIADDDPCIFVEALSVLFTPGAPPDRGKPIPLGRANVVCEGTDVTVITYGPQVGIAKAVAEKLKGTISVEVLDLRSIAPLDNESILRSVRKTRRAVIIHEAVKKHGVGAEIAASINEALFDELESPVLRVAARFCPVPFSKPLEAAYLPTLDELETAVRSSFSRGRRS
jgi:pyruvate/2-oxoglutarate/acetoin dehydrogenase E1 component